MRKRNCCHIGLTDETYEIEKDAACFSGIASFFSYLECLWIIQHLC